MKRVLLVDDEPEVLEVLRIRMKNWGYTCDSAPNGAVALEKISKEKPDLIILDVMMPDMDGFEVLKRLKANDIDSKIPVIMLSVAASIPEIEKGIKAGASAYLAKPYEANELLRTIKKVLKES
ncbi:MAG: response regulator [Candidatus Margulisiibacteriota bacterium]|nr:response regulator [Candidatus Margulisiibacteriota bacterium]